MIAPPGTAALAIPFCGTSVPTWFAYQNEGYVPPKKSGAMRRAFDKLFKK